MDKAKRTLYFCRINPKKQTEMELIPVKTTAPYYAEAERLMTDAFPPEERRPLERQRQYTDHNPLFHPQVVVENGTFAHCGRRVAAALLTAA